MDFNATIWNYKKERGVALSQELATIVYAPKELESFKRDLEAMHRIKELRFVEPTEEVKSITRRLKSDVFILD